MSEGIPPSNLAALLNGQQQRQADAEFEIARLERKLIEQRLEYESATEAVRAIESLIEKERKR